MPAQSGWSNHHHYYQHPIQQWKGIPLVKTNHYTAKLPLNEKNTIVFWLMLISTRVLTWLIQFQLSNMYFNVELYTIVHCALTFMLITCNEKELQYNQLFFFDFSTTCVFFAWNKSRQPRWEDEDPAHITMKKGLIMPFRFRRTVGSIRSYRYFCAGNAERMRRIILTCWLFCVCQWFWQSNSFFHASSVAVVSGSWQDHGWV